MRRSLMLASLAAAALALALVRCGSDAGDAPPLSDGSDGGGGSRQDAGKPEAGGGQDAPGQDAVLESSADGSASPFLSWVNDPSVWSDLELPPGATSVCPKLSVAASGRIFPFVAVWEGCGEGCSQLRMGEDIGPTRRADQISMGIASEGQTTFPLAAISDTDYEFGGPPASFEVVRWVDLSTLEAIGAVQSRIEGDGCCGYMNTYEDPRVTSADVKVAGEKRQVLARFDLENRTVATSAPFTASVIGQFIPMREAGLMPIPTLSALFYDGKTVVPVEQGNLGALGSGRDDIALWRLGSSEVRGWRNDGLGARPWLTGLADKPGVLSVAPDRIVGTSRLVDGDNKPIGTRFWHTSSREAGSPVTSGPVVVPFHVAAVQALGDWAVFDGVAADGGFHGVIRLADFRVWRIPSRSSDVEYLGATFALDAQRVYFAEKQKKHENRTATALVRYDLANIESIGAPQPTVGP